MTEPLIMALLVAGPACWMIGGGVSGWNVKLKWVRRFLLPVLYAGTALIAGVPILQSIGLLAAAVVVNSLGYGDRAIWPVKVIVFLAIPAPAMILNLWAFPAVLVSGALITGLAWATRKWNAVSHKLFEATAGLAQAAALVIGLLI